MKGYVLSRISNDLPQHPILSDLRWDHLSDLQLADPDFKTPSRVDILLGSEVFQEILCDGRRKGPPGTPSAIDTLLGWVVFGKVKGEDVRDTDDGDRENSDSDDGNPDAVEITNQTLQRYWDHYRKLQERYPHVFLAVVRTDKDKDFRYRRRKKRLVVKGQPHSPTRYVDHRTRRERFDRSRNSHDARKIGPASGKCWETGGFRPAGCWRQNARYRALPTDFD